MKVLGTKIFFKGGLHDTKVNILDSHPAPLGLILRSPQNFSLDAAEIY